MRVFNRTSSNGWRELRLPFLVLGITLALGGCGGSAAPASGSTGAAGSAKPAGGSSAAASAAASSASTGGAGASAAASGASVAANPAASGSRTLTVAYGTGSSATFSPLWLADASGAFTKHGVNVSLKFVQSSVSTAALLSKEVDLVAVSAAPVLTADINGQVDEVYVASIFNSNTAVLFAQPAIKSPADLKGKIVGSDKPGTPTDFFVRLMLTKMNLKPADVQLRGYGGSEVTTPGLLAGQIDAAASTPPITFQLQAKGYNQLADTYGDPYLANGYIVLRNRLAELAPALPGYLMGIRDGIGVFNDQPDFTKKILAQYSKETDQAVIQKTYDFYKDPKHAFDPSLRVKDPTLQSMLDYLGETTIPAAKSAKPQQFYDMRFVDQIGPA
jgi:NitT/TauT family transport system substrate-binding protein